MCYGPASTKASEASTTKLLKLELSTFHGNTYCAMEEFREQSCVFVHDRTNIPKKEKLVFLQNIIKDKTKESDCWSH